MSRSGSRSIMASFENGPNRLLLNWPAFLPYFFPPVEDLGALDNYILIHFYFALDLTQGGEDSVRGLSIAFMEFPSFAGFFFFFPSTTNTASYMADSFLHGLS